MMLSTITLINLFIVAVGILYVVIRTLFRERSLVPLPPGPSPNPIVGNLADLPPTGVQDWQHWLKHKEAYGPISSVTVFGQTLVIINDFSMATELLEKRSALHSSRPRMMFCGEMVGWEYVLALLPYSDRMRTYRKNIHGILGSKWVISQFNDLQDVEVRRFLLRMLERPEDLGQNIRKNAGAIILKIVYGYTIEPYKDDPLVDLIEEALVQFSLATVPGAWLVDIIPALKYLPNWFPGTGFKRTAIAWRKTTMEATNKPFEFVKQQMARQTNKPSYVSKLLAQNDGNLSLEDERSVKWSALSLYGGGADTTVSSLNCFFLTMTLYPEIQRKAQEEIDRIVGNKRLPSIEDRENLPYVNAVVKEVLRWHPIGPMGLPHMTTEDDVFHGYLIPKGALILANIWAFAHDPNVFHEPSTFKPERFLGLEGRKPEPDPDSFVFGFGRRKCPGRVLADGSVYLTIAQTLAVFDITKVVEDGKEVEPIVGFTPGTISHPEPFRTSIKPRSPEHEALIRSILVDHPWEESDAKFL